MKIRQVFAYVALAFLLLSQQLGIAHAISHISSDSTSSSSQKKQLPGELQCEDCLAFAALGSGLLSSPPSVALLPASTDIAVAQLHFKLLPASPRAFDSRAPPIFV